MKKYILMLAVAAATTLVACGNKEANTEVTEPVDSVEVVEEVVETVDTVAAAADSVVAAADSVVAQ